MTREPVRSRENTVLMVRAGGEIWGLPAASIRQIVRGASVYSLPASAAYLLGLAAIEGEPTPVVDLHSLARGGPPVASGRTTVLIGRREGRAACPLGLAIDEALELVVAPHVSVTARPDSLLVGTVDDGGRSISVLDPELLFSEEER